MPRAPLSEGRRRSRVQRVKPGRAAADEPQEPRGFEDDPAFGEVRNEPRLDPGDAVHVRCVEPGLTVRMVRNISGSGFSIVTDTAPAPEVALHFEFATSSRLFVTVPATPIYSHPLDSDGHYHINGWSFSQHPDAREAVATIIDFLLARLVID